MFVAEVQEALTSGHSQDGLALNAEVQEKEDQRSSRNTLHNMKRSSKNADARDAKNMRLNMLKKSLREKLNAEQRKKLQSVSVRRRSGLKRSDSRSSKQ